MNAGKTWYANRMPTYTTRLFCMFGIPDIIVKQQLAYQNLESSSRHANHANMFANLKHECASWYISNPNDVIAVAGCQPTRAGQKTLKLSALYVFCNIHVFSVTEDGRRYPENR